MPSEFLWPSAALLLGSLLSFLLALAPTTYYDSLVYHFALPAAYVQAHHWVGLPQLIYSAFPQTLEMLWTLGLLLRGETVSHLIAWSLGLFLLIAMISYGRRFLNISVGLMAAALCVLMPAFLLLNSEGYVDIGLTLFCFMSFYAACVAISKPEKAWFFYAGLFAGWAMGIKYTGGLPAFVTFLLLALYTKKASFAEARRGLFLFGASALVIFSPWLIKNTIYVGNPVFPFFYQWGLQRLNPWLGHAAEGYFAGITEYGSASILQLPKALWTAATNGAAFGRGADVLGAFGWTPLLGLLPALWLCRKLPAAAKWLLLFSGTYLLAWGLSRPVLRFLLPVAPMLALLAAYGWVHGVRPQSAPIRWIARGFLASFLISGGLLFADAMGIMTPLEVALGLESRDAYLTRKIDYYGAATFINQQTPENSRVFVFGDQRGYYYQRALWISPVFSKNPLMESLNAGASAASIQQQLKEQGVTHLVFNHSEFRRLQSYPFIRFNEQGQRIWDQFRKGFLSPLYQDGHCEVYAL